MDKSAPNQEDRMAVLEEELRKLRKRITSLESDLTKVKLDWKKKAREDAAKVDRYGR